MDSNSNATNVLLHRNSYKDTSQSGCRSICWAPGFLQLPFNRKKLLLISLICLVNVLGLLYLLARRNIGILVATDPEIACRLPDLNPYDPSIKKYTKTNYQYKHLNCESYHAPLFTSDLYGNLIQLEEPENHGYFDCCWDEFFRHVNDYSIKTAVATSCSQITNKTTKIPPPVEFIAVSCMNKYFHSKQVVGIFGFTPLKPVKDQPAFEEPKNKRRVNVLIFGVDAVSRMNFHRNFNASYAYLMKNLSAIEMWGYNKHGTNTFPNMLSAYTGLTVDELEKRNWNSSIPLDDIPFIWKDFSREGYRTAFTEDAVKVAAFNYLKKGFSKPPTDYYHHPLTRYMDAQIGHAPDKKFTSANLCFGNKLAFDVLLEMMKKLAVTMNKSRRYFHLTWATSLTHHYLNYGRLGDKYLKETLRWLHTEGYLEDTVFIAISDHGIRTGDFQSTFQGRIEERMPFLYVVVPPWFKAKYPSAIKNLEINQRRLTTHFDTYETLLDLLHLENLEEIKLIQRQLELQKTAKIPRGISLFLPVPPGRSCKDAGIPIHWCTCGARVPVELERNEIVTEAAKQIVLSINSMLSSHPKCSALELDSILGASLFDSEDNRSKGVVDSILKFCDNWLNKHPLTYRFVVRLNPSRGTFEATVTHLVDGRWNVSQEMSRTNQYGNQGYCILDYKLKKFCYCD